MLGTIVQLFRLIILQGNLSKIINWTTDQILAMAFIKLAMQSTLLVLIYLKTFEVTRKKIRVPKPHIDLHDEIHCALEDHTNSNMILRFLA